MQEIDTTSARGIDAPESRRPGHPQKKAWSELDGPPRPSPALQARDPRVLKDAQRDELTATFGTGQRPRGLSGWMRRVAYRIPDYRVRRWMLLLAADRVDALEWRLGVAARSPIAWATIAVVAGGGFVAAHVIASRRARAQRSPKARWRAVMAGLGR